MPRGLFAGGILSGGICPRGLIFREFIVGRHLTSGAYSRGTFVRVAFVLGLLTGYLLLEQYASYSVSVSAVEILFASNVNIDISMIKQESSRQRVRYLLTRSRY